MQSVIDILGKPVNVAWSVAAERKMSELASPLLAEMELYFSCLLRKKVRFNEAAHDVNRVTVTPRLQVGFRPVMTQKCGVEEVAAEDAPPLADFPIVNPAAFVPRWLHIDFHGGQWVGDFGFDLSEQVI